MPLANILLTTAEQTTNVARLPLLLSLFDGKFTFYFYICTLKVY